MIDINGIKLIAVVLGHPLTDGRKANGFELAASSPWTDVTQLKGLVIPGIGEALEVGAPRVDPLPAGSRINIVTKG